MGDEDVGLAAESGDEEPVTTPLFCSADACRVRKDTTKEARRLLSLPRLQTRSDSASSVDASEETQIERASTIVGVVSLAVAVKSCRTKKPGGESGKGGLVIDQKCPSAALLRMATNNGLAGSAPKDLVRSIRGMRQTGCA